MSVIRHRRRKAQKAQLKKDQALKVPTGPYHRHDKVWKAAATGKCNAKADLRNAEAALANAQKQGCSASSSQVTSAKRQIEEARGRLRKMVKILNNDVQSRTQRANRRRC